MNKLIYNRCFSTLRACIIGSGPAGCYAVKGLLAQNFKVDVLEKKQIPFGLLRYGVAPDHQSIKKLQTEFIKVISNPKVTFVGNVAFEKDIKLKELEKIYNIIVIAFGTTSPMPIRVEGKESPNVLPAMNFVKWYNGDSECAKLKPNLDHDTVSVIGNGNVAIDCARILAIPPIEFIKSELSPVAYEMISKNKVKNIHIIGRRGPFQSSFDLKEYREIKKYANVILNKDDFLLGMSKSTEIEISKKTVLQHKVKEFNKDSFLEIDPNKKNIYFHFLHQPISYSILENDIIELKCNRTRLVGEPFNQKSEATSENTLNIKNGLLLYSTGTKMDKTKTSLPLSKNERSLDHINGKVIGYDSLYCCGWCNSGGSGNIGSTYRNVSVTLNTIKNDVKNNKIRSVNITEQSILDILPKNKKYTNMEEVMKILEQEKKEQKRIIF